MSHSSPTASGGSGVATPQAPVFRFESDPSVAPFAIPLQEYLRLHQDSDHGGDGKGGFVGACSGAVVFDRHDRVLLIQRAAHDSWPLRWEVPGGAIDDEDPTMLHGVVRELWEEAGLLPARVGRLVRVTQDGPLGAVFLTSRKLRVIKFTFEVEIDATEPVVKLDPNEHANWTWATEEEIRDGRVGDMEVKMTTENQRVTLLEAFRMRKESRTLRNES